MWTPYFNIYHYYAWWRWRWSMVASLGHFSRRLSPGDLRPAAPKLRPAAPKITFSRLHVADSVIFARRPWNFTLAPLIQPILQTFEMPVKSDGVTRQSRVWPLIWVGKYMCWSILQESNRLFKVQTTVDISIQVDIKVTADYRWIYQIRRNQKRAWNHPIMLKCQNPEAGRLTQNLKYDYTSEDNDIFKICSHFAITPN